MFDLATMIATLEVPTLLEESWDGWKSSISSLDARHPGEEEEDLEEEDDAEEEDDEFDEIEDEEDIDDDFARAEGRGYRDAAAWRVAHEAFFRSEGISAYLGHTPAFDDETLVLAERFRVVEP